MYGNSNTYPEHHPDDIMGVSDGMGARTCCIPMVNETDATPVKISGGSLFPFSSCDVSPGTVKYRGAVL